MKGGIPAAVVLVLAACGSREPVAFDGAVADARADALVCAPGLTDCNGECVDLNSDRGNCGACGTECGVLNCSGEIEPGPGDCVSGMCLGSCPDGMCICSGSCVDPNSDDDHCGACDNACDNANGFTCISGTCSCISGGTDCGGVCVDTSSDPDNCGACGCQCAEAGTMCISGNCFVSCPSGQTPCPTGYVSAPSCPAGTLPLLVCVDTISDNENCGVCGHPCVGGKTCANGFCECPAGFANCSGVCVDTSSDPQNCGSCANVCAQGQSCANGSCGFPCPGIVCNGTCVDPTTDINNCGACNNKCTGGKSCQAGVCACPVGLTDCSGVCVDLQTDPSNCGACGVACTGGGVCAGGFCCSGMFPDYCYGVCVDLDTDESNCGTCGNTCSATEVCANGTCTASSPAGCTVTCPKTTVAATLSMQCTAKATLANGSTVDVTTAVTWSAVNSGACVSDAGVISNGPPSTQPAGTFTAVTAGCKSDVGAIYVQGATAHNCNTITVTVVP